MYYNEETTVYLNGKWIKAKDAQTDLYNQTMHYGNGVFEGIRAYDTEDGVQVFKAKEHFLTDLWQTFFSTGENLLCLLQYACIRELT